MKKYRSINSSLILPYLFLLITVSYVSIIYFYKIKYFPGFGGDESALLNIPYRAVTFGDLRFPVYFPQSAFDMGLISGMQPPFAHAFRSIIHIIFGFSAEASRFFSAFLMLSSSLIIIGTIKRHITNSSLQLIISFIIISLTPGMILAARTFRIEQEVLFWGVIGLFSVLGFSKKPHQLNWCLSGLCLGIACSSHPFGFLFPMAFIPILLLHTQAWHSLDHLSAMRRFCFWGMGFMLPVSITFVDIIYKPYGFFKYYEGIKKLTEIRNQTFIDIFSNNYSGLFHQWLPAKIKAFLFQIGHYSLSTEFIPYFINYYSVLSFILITFLLISFFIIIKRRDDPKFLPLAISTYFIFASLLLSYAFTKNQTYYVYLSVSLSAFLCILYLTLTNNKGIILFQKLSTLSIGFIFYGLFFLNFMSSFYLLRDAYPIQEETHLSLDTLHHKFKELRSDLKIQNHHEGETIIEPYTWPFAGKNTGSWITTLSGFHPKNPVAAAFSANNIDFFINVFPSITPNQIPTDLKQTYFNQTLNNMNLGAIIAIAPLNDAVYFYTKKEHNNHDLYFQIINSDSEILSFRKKGNIKLEFDKTFSSPLNTTLIIPSPGYYLLVLHPGGNDPKDRIVFSQNDDEIIPEYSFDKTVYSPHFYLFHLNKSPFLAKNLSETQVMNFNELDQSTPQILTHNTTNQFDKITTKALSIIRDLKKSIFIKE